jgi:hypothetical protein
MSILPVDRVCGNCAAACSPAQAILRARFLACLRIVLLFFNINSGPSTPPRAVVAGGGPSAFIGAFSHQERRLMDEVPRPTHRIALADVTKAGGGLPNRAIFHGVEGVGKTSFGACTPKPVFLMTRGETGLVTLIDAGQVAETAHFPEAASWPDLLDAVNALTAEAHDYRTLVIDALNGAERLCHEHVCSRDFGGNWGRDGFTSYMTGYDVALADWRAFLEALDRLRSERRMSVLALAHTRVTTFKNPEGADYDRYAVDVHHETWSLTHKWADLVLFAILAAAWFDTLPGFALRIRRLGERSCHHAE